MPSKEEIEEILISNELDRQLAFRINKVFETVNTEQKINGELSQFNRDICDIFDALVKRKPQENITATEILIKQQSTYMQNEKEKYLKNKIEQLEVEKKEVIEKVKEIEEKVTEERSKLMIKGYTNMEDALQEDRELLGKQKACREFLKIMKGK